MNPLASLAIVVGLVAVATSLGLLWRTRTGRVRAVPASRDDLRLIPSDVGAESAFGEGATLLQFSTEYCAPCRSTSALLGELADSRPSVVHLDVDLTDQPDLARRFHIMQTPTTLLLDGSGFVRARIGGAPRREEVRATLEEILEGSDVQFS